MKRAPTDHVYRLAEWSISIGSDGSSFVTEKTPTMRGHTIYGPMHADIVQPLIAERRTFFEAMMKRQSPYLFPDYAPPP